MKRPSLRVVLLAFTVLSIGFLAMPEQVSAASESGRGMWLAEWIRPQAQGSAPRSIGVLKLRDGRLTFAEQNGQLDWELDLASVKRLATANGGRALVVASITGDEFIVSIMQPDMTQGSPKKALSIIERAVQSLAASR